MSGPIKKGDLVIVIKPTLCCGSGHALGEVFEVDWLGVAGGGCVICGDSTPLEAASAPGETDTACALARLKKIDPPAAGEYDRVPVRKAQPKKVPA